MAQEGSVWQVGLTAPRQLSLQPIQSTLNARPISSTAQALRPLAEAAAAARSRRSGRLLSGKSDRAPRVDLRDRLVAVGLAGVVQGGQAKGDRPELVIGLVGTGGCRWPCSSCCNESCSRHCASRCATSTSIGGIGSLGTGPCSAERIPGSDPGIGATRPDESRPSCWQDPLAANSAVVRPM